MFKFRTYNKAKHCRFARTRFARPCSRRYMCRAIIFFFLAFIGGCDTEKAYTTAEPGEFSDGAANVPVNEFLLIKSNNTFAALKFVRPILDGDGGFEYECYYIEDGKGTFLTNHSNKTTGRVFEKYKRVPVEDEPDSFAVEDDGGQLLINCGNIVVEWSLRTWVYFRNISHAYGYTEMAFTGSSEIEQINYLSEHLKWHQKNDI